MGILMGIDRQAHSHWRKPKAGACDPHDVPETITLNEQAL